MEIVYSLRDVLRTGLPWSFPVAMLFVLMLAPCWALNFATPEFDLKNPRQALEAIRKSHDLPSLGAAIVTDEGLQLVPTTGVRKKGRDTPVTDRDLWHLGSCGKAMTATMIARLVEAGTMRFEQTLAETFPDQARNMDEQAKSIKLIDLLSHRSGLPRNFNFKAYRDERNVRLARKKALIEAIAKPLLSKPGDKYLYSNWGYILAGHMAEKATGKSWESLMKAEVFIPLKMSTAGLGGPGTKGKLDQPWPHSEDGTALPSNGKEMDKLPVMAPAGTIHMSLEDWGKFVTEHLKGRRGKSSYLKQTSFEKLHTAINDNYALGWITFRQEWAGGDALHHAGDNTMSYANVWVAPAKGFAVLVVSNQSSCPEATNDVAKGLIDAWVKAAMPEE